MFKFITNLVGNLCPILVYICSNLILKYATISRQQCSLMSILKEKKYLSLCGPFIFSISQVGMSYIRLYMIEVSAKRQIIFLIKNIVYLAEVFKGLKYRKFFLEYDWIIHFLHIWGAITLKPHVCWGWFLDKRLGQNHFHG